MFETFIALLAAHLVGDFLVQTDWIIRHKKNVAVILLHVAIVTALSLTFLGALDWRIGVIVFVSHGIMDAIKVHVLKDTLTAFAIDQAVHVAVIAALAFALPNAFDAGVWPFLLGVNLNAALAALTMFAGFVACVPVGGVVVRLASQPFYVQLQGPDGLDNGGQMIGWLERALVFVLALNGELTAIGFLVTAKSILRFGGLRDQERKTTEYVIIGTFMSIAWALAVSFATRAALGAYVGAFS